MGSDGQEIRGSYACDGGYCKEMVLGYREGFQQTVKCLGGKHYCLKCYPQAVDVYLADKRLKEASREG